MAEQKHPRPPAPGSDSRQWAEHYTARGLAVVPLAAGKKRPVLKGLPNRRLTPREIDRYFSPKSNIGLRCGEPSGGLVDVDGDSPEAVELFKVFLPRTELRHGRPGNPDCHWWFQCDTPPKTEKFCEPSGKVLVEIRSTGAHTMVPPSIHPSGERLRWVAQGRASDIDGAELRKTVGKVAAGALLARRWPKKGRRHDMTLALSGFLRRHDMPEQEAEDFVEVVSRVAGDEEAEDRRRDVRTTSDRLAAGEPATGIPTLVQILGRDGDRVIALLKKWLGLAEAAKSAPPIDGIDVTRHHLPTLAGQAWAAVRVANDPPQLFRYGNNLVRLNQGAKHGPSVEVLSADALVHFLARITRFYAVRQGEYQDAYPPMPIVRDMRVEPAPDVPNLTRVVEVPVFSADGELNTSPGYQTTTGVYYAPPAGFVVPPVPSRPTTRDIHRARALIVDELIDEFPFVDDADRAHAVAALILPFVRSLVQGPTPLHLIEKPTPGTGGTLLADVLVIPALGHSAPTMTEGSDDAEWRKRLTAKLVEGPSVLLIDNLHRRLESGALSAALTSTIWSDRVLGESKMVTVPIDALFIATGNNPALSDEIARRTIRIRLDAHTERPWERTEFRHPDLKGWALEHRADLVWAAGVLVKAWLAAGRPPGSARMGTFEGWAATLGGILDVAGIPGLLANQREFYDASTADSQLWLLFIKSWWRRFGSRPVAVSDLYDLIRDEGLPFDFRGRDEHGHKTSFGMQLRGHRDRQYGHYTIRWVAEIQGAQKWKLVEAASGRRRRRRR